MEDFKPALHVHRFQFCGDVDEHGQVIAFPSRRGVPEVLLPTLVQARRAERERRLAGLPPSRQGGLEHPPWLQGVGTPSSREGSKSDALEVKPEQSDEIARGVIQESSTVSHPRFYSTTPMTNPYARGALI